MHSYIIFIVNDIYKYSFKMVEHFSLIILEMILSDINST